MKELQYYTNNILLTRKKVIKVEKSEHKKTWNMSNAWVKGLNRGLTSVWTGENKN